MCSAGGKACNHLILSVWETDHVQRFCKQPRQVIHDKICTEKIIIKLTDNRTLCVHTYVCVQVCKVDKDTFNNKK